ncbi:hypothetical protein BC792_10785 [Sphingobacterium allocomposti]|uniref:Lipocalin-like protein n=1 Tax=Sphingobacterium allocomposti TaxID=415956 RepID=A0A5S5DMB8_9SPHI|nr:hypothetical protein [Sphingobacterium composti Yoo et al. 2007 non Ten et al. 2007]TYP96186.1 hypothetical protein BC792_10785 [Sphingobacterium composti Yoo et al. 2007 non Ten et al. 2007]
MSRDVLIKINYVFVALLLIGASLTVMYHENPERLIQGEWVEKDWRLEKANATPASASTSELQERLKREILQNIEDLHLGVWRFYKDGTLESAEAGQGNGLEWVIKGRGHVLEVRKDGKTVESFQIQQISKDKLVLHLNFDLQVKGIIEIVLERKGQIDQYAKKV